MKQLFLLLIAILSFAACSSDDNASSNNNNETYQKLIGKWYFADPEEYGYSTNNSFTFISNGKVTYSYWTGEQANDFDSETGTFSVKEDVLTMVYPETVTLTYVQKVIFISDNIVEFKNTGVSGENAYEGHYYKEP